MEQKPMQKEQIAESADAMNKETHELKQISKNAVTPVSFIQYGMR
jgi:hypothetical protein